MASRLPGLLAAVRESVGSVASSEEAAQSTLVAANELQHAAQHFGQAPDAALTPRLRK